MSGDFERELQRRFQEMEGPEDMDRQVSGTITRAWAWRRRRRQRRVATVAVATMLAAAGAAYAYTVIHNEDGRQVPEGRPGASERREANPLLQDLPWLYQPNRSKTVDETEGPASSVQFPPGTGYRRAARQLYLSISRDGTLPASARVRPPLERGIVAETSGQGVRLSLAAPFGYNPDNGKVEVPTISLPASLEPSEAAAIIEDLKTGDPSSLPAGAQIEWTMPADCQLRVAGAPEEPACAYIQRNPSPTPGTG